MGNSRQNGKAELSARTACKPGRGSEAVSFDSWLLSVPKKRQAVLLDDLETMAQAVPLVLESNHGPLFELGLDICLTKDGKVWLLDVNSKPGKHAFIKHSPEKGSFCIKVLWSTAHS